MKLTQEELDRQTQLSVRFAIMDARGFGIQHGILVGHVQAFRSLLGQPPGEVVDIVWRRIADLERMVQELREQLAATRP